MNYRELRILYPSIDRIMEKLYRSLSAGLDPDSMLEWALQELARVKDEPCRRAMAEKVKALVEIETGGQHDTV